MTAYASCEAYECRQIIELGGHLLNLVLLSLKFYLLNSLLARLKTSEFLTLCSFNSRKNDELATIFIEIQYLTTIVLIFDSREASIVFFSRCY